MAEEFDANLERLARELQARQAKKKRNPQAPPPPSGFGVGGYRPANGKVPPVINPVPKGGKPNQPAPPPPSTSKPPAVRSLAPTNRVDGRLVREPLQKLPSGRPSMPTTPMREGYQRKVDEMERGEAQPLRSLDEPEASEPTVMEPLFTARDIVRAIVFGEVLDEPRGRRTLGRPPHRR